MELISVIIPVYNAEKYLQKCIESVQRQTYENVEIILVDDGSTDNSLQICEGFAEKDSRITVIHKKNGGAASARNMGLDVCEGEYIYFVDCDDYITTNALEIMVNHLYEKQADMVVGDYTYVNERTDFFEDDCQVYLAEELMSGNQFLARNCVDDGKNVVFVWNKLYKKDIFINLRFEEDKIHEDAQVFHLVCSKCKRVAVVGEVLYFYTKRENSIMGSYDYSRGLDIFESYLKRIIYMYETGDWELQRAITKVINMFFYMAFSYSEVLGFDNENLNLQMKSSRKEVFRVIPIFLKDTSRSMRERIACSIWLFSPRIYGKIWGDKNNGTK